MNKKFPLLVFSLLFLFACGESKKEVVPQNIPPGESCALDGMILGSHVGPKSQALMKDGTHKFYCDTKEIFEAMQWKGAKNRFRATWFQVQDDRSWEAHADGWATGEELFFVAFSKKMGAMGPTLVPFRDRQKAEEFLQSEGGRVVRLRDVDSTLLDSVRNFGMEKLNQP